VGEPKRATGLVVIDDGYTLVGECKDADGRRTPLRFKYRPALPEAVYEYRAALMRARAAPAAGAEQLNAVVALLDAHVESWEGVYRRGAGGVEVAVPFAPGRKGPGGQPVPGSLADPAVRRAVGTDYLDQMVNFVTGYDVGMWEADAGN